jgi:hypothetical protein
VFARHNVAAFGILQWFGTLDPCKGWSSCLDKGMFVMPSAVNLLFFFGLIGRCEMIIALALSLHGRSDGCLLRVLGHLVGTSFP